MKKLTLAFLVLMLAIPAIAQAPSRIAVIDVNRVLAESAAGKAAYTALQNVQKGHVAKIQEMEEEITRLEADYQQKRLSLSEDNLAAVEKQISDKRVALQRYGQDAERDLQAQRAQTMKTLNDRIMPLVEEVGKEMGFAVIFNKYESGLVYASDAVDITNVIVQRVDQMGQAN